MAVHDIYGIGGHRAGNKLVVAGIAAYRRRGLRRDDMQPRDKRKQEVSRDLSFLSLTGYTLCLQRHEIEFLNVEKSSVG